MKSLNLTLGLALCFTGFSSKAAQTVGTEGWCRCSDGGVTMISQKSVSQTALWAGRLSQFLHAAKGRLPGDPRLLGPLTVVVFDSRGDFLDSAPVLESGSVMRNEGGFTRSGGWGAIVAICDAESTELTQRVLFDGAAGWLLSGYHHRMPIALGTGLREVYGAYVVDRDREIFGQPPQGWTSMLQSAVDHPLSSYGRFLKVEDLLSVTDLNAVADRHGTGMFSVESWGFAHFLLCSKDMAKARAMDRLLNAFGGGATPHEALIEVFGDGASAINLRFRNYILGGDFYEVSGPVEPAPLVGSPVPAEPGYVAAVLAHLEASAGHPDVARSYGEQAVRLAPDQPESHDAMALLDFDLARHAEAAAESAEAIRLGTRDGWTWLVASREAAAENPGPAEARTAINDAERAIVCCHGFEAAYDQVAALIPAADHVTDDDGKFLAFGTAVLPTNGRIRIGRAQWAKRSGDDALALQVVDEVLADSGTFGPAATRMAHILRNQWTAGPADKS